MERIRVLHVITRLILGGAQENTLLTVARLDRARYSVTLASGPTTGPEGSLEDQIPREIAFERIPELVRDPHPIKDALALWRLYSLMRRDRYHIVHTHMTKAGLLGRIAARLAGIPIVIHTPHGHAFHGYLNSVGSLALVGIERWLARWTDRIICLTEGELADHLRVGICTPEQFDIIPSGVDIEHLRQVRVAPEVKRQELGLAVRGPLVGCVARLVPIKGVRYLLEAAPLVRAAVPQATFIFVGDGPLRVELESRAATLGLNGAVVFLGLRRDIAEIIQICDVMILPSLNEGMGRAAVQALAAGRPVIGSRVCGIESVIKDGETGLLVPPADPGALAEAIIRCLMNPNLVRALGRQGQRDVGAYGITQMISKIEDLYSRLLTRSQMQRL